MGARGRPGRGFRRSPTALFPVGSLPGAALTSSLSCRFRTLAKGEISASPAATLAEHPAAGPPPTVAFSSPPPSEGGAGTALGGRLRPRGAGGAATLSPESRTPFCAPRWPRGALSLLPVYSVRPLRAFWTTFPGVCGDVEMKLCCTQRTPPSFPTRSRVSFRLTFFFFFIIKCFQFFFLIILVNFFIIRKSICIFPDQFGDILSYFCT